MVVPKYLNSFKLSKELLVYSVTDSHNSICICWFYLQTESSVDGHRLFKIGTMLIVNVKFQ